MKITMRPWLPALLAVAVLSSATAQANEPTRQDVAPLDLGLAFIEALKPQSYRVSNDASKLHFGFSEPEIQAVLGTRETNLVQQEDGRWTYTSAELLAPMVKAIQELATRTTANDETLAAQMDDLLRAMQLMARGMEKLRAEFEQVKAENRRLRETSQRAPAATGDPRIVPPASPAGH